VIDRKSIDLCSALAFWQKSIYNEAIICSFEVYDTMKSVSIRFEEEMLEKIGYVADYEGRSVNSQVLVLVRECIKQFEQEHGPIRGSVQPDENVKPGRSS